ncbi:hypothetical protein KGF57_001300 [Candida theae]|uniref:N-acetyltransferase domain-containing protein n=1 Tax=Candida theae TaxID=1198502 RepID=A0AAD5BHC1_9ASCO|nr:uncharacterized protein KGF57_001300 [Candida theae]KAI5963355.1 hypothetical protein KGF57_001300 [Candida theae]
MSKSDLQFKSTQDPAKLKELFTLCGSEWGGPLDPEEFGKVQTESFEEYIKSGLKIEGFYIEDTSKGLIVATTIIKHLKGLYKPADRSSLISSVPDPSLFGIKNITSLLVSFVFTHKDYRRKGLAEQCISQAIAATEREIVDHHLQKSDESANDSFRKMTLDNFSGEVDQELANYYLGKEYVWFLFSGVQTYYKRFGFKGYPIDFYEIPVQELTEGQETVLKQLIEDSESQNQHQPDAKSKILGKRIKLLDWDRDEDQEVIQFILQTKELEILSELNKLSYHSELQGDRKSSTSLTNMSNILSMTKIGSHSTLSAIGETTTTGKPRGSEDGSRRKSSALNQTVPKFAIKPSFADYKSKVVGALGYAKSDQSKKFTKLQGAIITNDLQRRSYYILWNSLKGEFFITGMGEIIYESVLPSTNSQRRGSSFTGLNDLGGYNFQDLDILISAALYTAKNRSPKFQNVYVSTHDLPSDIPDAVMHDFFINYLPFSSYASDEHKEKRKEAKSTGSEEHRVELLADNGKKVGVLPMVRQFGSGKSEFEVDWLENGMWCWG